jgi:diguanylate cyclase (GGDEF)-like protein
VIDVKTFMLVLAIGNIGFALLMAGYAHGHSGNRAMRIWTWAKFIQGVAHLLGFLRPDYPAGWLPYVSNSLLLLGVATEVFAYSRFFHLRGVRRSLAPMTVLAIMIYLAARYGGAAPNQTTSLMSAIIALYTGVMTVMLFGKSNGPHTPVQRIIGITTLLFFVAMVTRAVASALDPSIWVFATGMVQSFAFLAGYLLLIVNGFGFLLLCKQRDDRKMEQLATIDSLTGLVNRRAFFERTEGARQLAKRLARPITMMMLDIDHFKKLNDRFGHATGDEALCLFAYTARATLREPDIMGRLGGEEFALVLPGTDLDGAMHAAERLRVAVAGAPLLTDGNQYRMSVSIGVVLIDPDEHINAALARADHALYAAKSQGRDRVVCGEVDLESLRQSA